MSSSATRFQRSPSSTHRRKMAHVCRCLMESPALTEVQVYSGWLDCDPKHRNSDSVRDPKHHKSDSVLQSRSEHFCILFHPPNLVLHWSLPLLCTFLTSSLFGSSSLTSKWTREHHRPSVEDQLFAFIEAAPDKTHEEGLTHASRIL